VASLSWNVHFCAEDFNDAALVCKSCGRDLRLVLPIIQENLSLVREAGRLQLQVKPPAR